MITDNRWRIIMKNSQSFSMRIACVIFLMTFFSPCPQSEGQPAGNDSSYFPLGIGEQWVYVFQYSSDTVRIVDTARIHGKLYFGVLLPMMPRLWLREFGDSVYVLEDTTSSTETLVYNFDAAIGENWSLPVQHGCGLGIKIALVSTTDTLVTPAGTFINCYRFAHQPDCIDAGMMYSLFAKGIGPVAFFSESIAGMVDYRLSAYEIVTSTGPPALSVRSYGLLRNYPNPFNPTTVIAYQIPERGFVTLKVIDLLGRDVAVLVDGQQQAGTHKASWDAAGFPGGVYFAILRTPVYSSVQKLVLLK